jgi:hypothetical protein
MKRLTVRVPDELHEHYTEAVHLGRTNLNDATVELIHAYVAHSDRSSIIHLDGTVCPISQLVLALAETTRSELLARHRA